MDGRLLDLEWVSFSSTVFSFERRLLQMSHAKQSFYNYFAAESLPITCDTCDRVLLADLIP